MAVTVLYADADAQATQLASQVLGQAGLRVLRASDAVHLERELAREAIDVLVVDAGLLGPSALGWICEAGQRWPDLPVVLLTSGDSAAEPVAALRAGAAGVLGRGAPATELVQAVQNAAKTAEHMAASPPPAATSTPDSAATAVTLMLGDCPAMREVHALVQRASATSATVLVRGESGSGKEVIARRIHELGPRRQGPFVKVHCAALPESLLESELFGYEKGAFTGATARKPGRVEIAEGGTLFLDEIGDISLATQVKLLRVLQDKEYERVGGTRTIRADVRFIAATHRHLEDMIRCGKFREDLYYRLNVIPIVAPPLRARPGDIELLSRHFCQSLGAQNGKSRICLTPEASALLRTQPWPGNVRQLQNFIERLVVFAETDEISAESVRAELNAGLGAAPATSTGGGLDFSISVFELDEVVRRAEKAALKKALDKAGGNRTLAARILGVSRRTLYNKLEEHQLL